MSVETLEKLEYAGRVWIPMRLPGMNEILAAAKHGHAAATKFSAMKRDNVRLICAFLVMAKLQGTPYSGIYCNITWREADRRRDPDNIAAGVKFIFDAFQEEGIIENDGWKQIIGWNNFFSVCKTEPGVLVEIYRRK